jgi:hypothetical protein
VSGTGRSGRGGGRAKQNKLIDLSKMNDKVSDAVCLLRESPFRILRVSPSISHSLIQPISITFRVALNLCLLKSWLL